MGAKQKEQPQLILSATTSGLPSVFHWLSDALCDGRIGVVKTNTEK